MPNKKISVGIAADDLKVGDFVSIVKNRRNDQPRFILQNDGDDKIRVIKGHENEMISGVPHKVLGISWPWVVFGVLLPGGDFDGPTIHDLRRIKCMKLNSEYVNAIEAFKRNVEEEMEEDDHRF